MVDGQHVDARAPTARSPLGPSARHRLLRAPHKSARAGPYIPRRNPVPHGVRAVTRHPRGVPGSAPGSVAHAPHRRVARPAPPATPAIPACTPTTLAHLPPPRPPPAQLTPRSPAQASHTRIPPHAVIHPCYCRPAPTSAASTVSGGPALLPAPPPPPNRGGAGGSSLPSSYAPQRTPRAQGSASTATAAHPAAFHHPPAHPPYARRRNPRRLPASKGATPDRVVREALHSAATRAPWRCVRSRRTRTRHALGAEPAAKPA